jgi:hypothetical protein
MTRGAYWLTIPQAALELKIGTAEVRRLIQRGQLPSVREESVGLDVVSRESVEHVKEQLAAGEIRLSW